MFFAFVTILGLIAQRFSFVFVSLSAVSLTLSVCIGSLVQRAVEAPIDIEKGNNAGSAGS